MTRTAWLSCFVATLCTTLCSTRTLSSTATVRASRVTKGCRKLMPSSRCKSRLADSVAGSGGSFPGSSDVMPETLRPSKDIRSSCPMLIVELPGVGNRSAMGSDN